MLRRPLPVTIGVPSRKRVWDLWALFRGTLECNDSITMSHVKYAIADHKRNLLQISPMVGVFQAPVLAERSRDDRSVAKEWTMKQCLTIRGCKIVCHINGIIRTAVSASSSHITPDRVPESLQNNSHSFCY